VTWLLSGDEHVVEYRPPRNVTTIEAGKTLESLLETGEIAAAIGVQVDSPLVKPLFPNAKEAGFDALRRRGLYPINHTVVIRNDALEGNRALASDVFDVFVEAKRIYLERLRSGRVADADSTHLRVMEAIGDPLPYGIEENRRNLEAIVQYSVEQGILSRPFRIEELFASRG
jgi:4,5-dihydroxyphthalate decarboxylase